MRAPEQVIAEAIRYDHQPGSGARAILDALRDEGYVIVARGSNRTPETTRMFGDYGSRPRSLRPSPMVGELDGAA